MSNSGSLKQAEGIIPFVFLLVILTIVTFRFFVRFKCFLIELFIIFEVT